ncbi:MAG: metallophosphoesterase [Fimbriimonadaceae bacterium]|nr:metallophosphoesterase [Fimbriimonadaceae bacterium]
MTMSDGSQPPKKMSRRKFLSRAFFGAAALTGLDAFLIEPGWLEFVQVDIRVPKLPPLFDGYRIAHLSDIHFMRGVSPDFVREAIAMANSFRPDLFVFTGDFCDHKATPKVPSFKGIFDGCLARDGVYGVLGNHDHWLDAEGVVDELHRSTPVRILDNESVLISRGTEAFVLAGVGDLWEGRIDPQHAFWGRDPKMARIMLAHNPDFADEMARDHPGQWCDLQLAGHTHGGQWKVPFGAAPMIPSKYGQRFRCGYVVGKSHPVYVTRGVTSINRGRFLCRPEVTGIVLRSGQAT